MSSGSGRGGASRTSKWGRLALAAASVLFALGAAELALRWLGPDLEALAGVSGTRLPSGTVPTVDNFEVDPDLGYRPRFGTELFDDRGAVPNDYPTERRPGVARLLFLGDSVTFRGTIPLALEALCADAEAEYWRVGVEGYNTVQEVEYYHRFARSLAPDKLILTFHNNDFFATPVAMPGSDGEFAVIVPDRSIDGWRPDWMRASRLYRAWFRWRLRRLPRRDLGVARAETTAALERLRASAAEDGVELSVLLLPILAPYDDWTPEERGSRAASIEIFERLDLVWYDLLTPARVALEAGIDLRSAPGDSWHPNPDAGQLFAGYLLDQGLLQGTTWSACREPKRWHRFERQLDRR